MIETDKCKKAAYCVKEKLYARIHDLEKRETKMHNEELSFDLLETIAALLLLVACTLAYNHGEILWASLFGFAGVALIVAQVVRQVYPAPQDKEHHDPMGKNWG